MTTSTQPARRRAGSGARTQLVERVVASFAGDARPAPAGADAGADPAPARLPARGAAHRGGVAAGHRVPHRRRAHHRRPAAGVHPALRRARRLHADGRPSTTRRTPSATEATVLRARSSSRTRPPSSSAATSPAAPPGEPCWVEGTVTDTDGKPVPARGIEVWEADEDGFYDVQYDDDRVAARGHLFADERRPLPRSGRSPRRRTRSRTTGPVGALLAAVRPLADARVAPALHGAARRACAPWSRTSSSRGDELLERDSVFGVRESLVMDFERHAAGTPTPDGRDRRRPQWTTRAVRHRARPRRRGLISARAARTGRRPPGRRT